MEKRVLWGNIRQCFASGIVVGESEVGGLVGKNDGTVENCFAGGSVSGIDSVGGIIGRSAPGDLLNSYSTCLIQRESGQHSSGLIGDPFEHRILGSFWDVETSGVSSGKGGTGLITALLQDRQTYMEAGWDFMGESENGSADVWLMPELGGYPELSLFHGMRPSLPFHSGVALGRCTLSEDPNEVMWSGAEVFDVVWDQVSRVESIGNPIQHPSLDPGDKTRVVTVNGRLSVLDSRNLLGIDTRQGVVCQVLDEQGESLSLKGSLSPFEPSFFCWAILPETLQPFELQFQLDSQQPMPSVLSQVDFYVYSLDCDLLTTIDVPFEPMDTWQELVPGFEVMINNVVVGDGTWEYAINERKQGQVRQLSIVPGAIECEVFDSLLGIKPSSHLWDVDILVDQRTIYGANHTSTGGTISHRGETIDGMPVTITTTKSTGHLDIVKLQYTFALSTHKRIVPLTLTNIPMP